MPNVFDFPILKVGSLKKTGALDRSSFRPSDSKFVGDQSITRDISRASLTADRGKTIGGADLQVHADLDVWKRIWDVRSLRSVATLKQP